MLRKNGNEILFMKFCNQSDGIVSLKCPIISINCEKNVALAREVLRDGNLGDKAEYGHEKREISRGNNKCQVLSKIPSENGQLTASMHNI